MYHASCDVCGKENKHMYQIFVRRIDTTGNPDNYCVCPDCFKAMFAVFNPSAELDINTSTKETQDTIPDISGIVSNIPEPEPTTLFNPINDQMKGMTLKEFLQTPFYLNTLNVTFKNREDAEIMDFKPYLNKKILHIYMPGATNGYIVILD